MAIENESWGVVRLGRPEELAGEEILLAGIRLGRAPIVVHHDGLTRVAAGEGDVWGVGDVVERHWRTTDLGLHGIHHGGGLAQDDVLGVRRPGDGPVHIRQDEVGLDGLIDSGFQVPVDQAVVGSGERVLVAAGVLIPVRDSGEEQVSSRQQDIVGKLEVPVESVRVGRRQIVAGSLEGAEAALGSVGDEGPLHETDAEVGVGRAGDVEPVVPVVLRLIEDLRSEGFDGEAVTHGEVARTDREVDVDHHALRQSLGERSRVGFVCQEAAVHTNVITSFAPGEGDGPGSRRGVGERGDLQRPVGIVGAVVVRGQVDGQASADSAGIGIVGHRVVDGRELVGVPVPGISFEESRTLGEEGPLVRDADGRSSGRADVHFQTDTQLQQGLIRAGNVIADGESRLGHGRREGSDVERIVGEGLVPGAYCSALPFEGHLTSHATGHTGRREAGISNGVRDGVVRERTVVVGSESQVRSTAGCSGDEQRSPDTVDCRDESVTDVSRRVTARERNSDVAGRDGGVGVKLQHGRAIHTVVQGNSLSV